MKKFNISGMSCAACASKVEKATKKVAGVSSCNVNLLCSSMTVEGDASADDIIAAVVAAGYGASEYGKAAESKSASEKSDESRIVVRLISSAVLLVILMYISMGHNMLNLPLPGFFTDNPIALGLAELILSGAVMVINGKFFVNGARGLLHGSPNMDTLVAMGSAVSFAYSTAIVFKMTASENKSAFTEDLYFESAAMILVLITVGKLLEAHSKGKTTDAIKSLVKLAPETATVIDGEKEKVVPISALKAGDIFILRPGDKIPADAVVTEGESSVDESSITGESAAADKAAGDKVVSGTVNLSGFLKCKAEAVGESSTLQKIIRTVSDASASKAPIARLADRVAGVFVPTVMGISALTFALWLISGESFGFAVGRAVSVLVISCPCSLGLATPVAVMVGNGVGAKNGILFKNAAALETAGKIKTAVFDKTGTITYGKPELTDIIAAEDKAALTALAYALEKRSEHPIAKAIVGYAENSNCEKYEADGFSAYSGSGVGATVNGEKAYGGNAAFVEKFAEVPQSFIDRAEALAKEGKTPVYFVSGGVFRGIIAVADKIKEDAAEAITAIKKSGIDTVMLTGDNRNTAEAVAKKVGIDKIIAGVYPDKKAAAVKELAVNGKLAMIGDGINDAPALTCADLGIAMGAGTDIAIDSADAVVTGSELYTVCKALTLGRKTLINIKENLFWAFFYNAICIPLAAGALYKPFGIKLNPMIAAAAMSLSSVCVVLNALRLNTVKLNKSHKSLNSKENIKMQKVFRVEGMMCSHCEAAVKKCLEAIPGVESASPDHNRDTVSVTLTQDIDDGVIVNAIEQEGYKVVRK